MGMAKKEDSLIEGVEEFLQDILENADLNKEIDRSSSVGRKPILPSLVLWSSLLVAVLRGFQSQLSIWRLISWKGFWHHPKYEISDQAVYNRLANDNGDGMREIFDLVRDGMQDRLEPYKIDIASFATHVFSIDGSTLDKVARKLPSLRNVPNGSSELLSGKLVALFDVRLQQWRDLVHLDNPNQNDRTVARQLVENLPKKSLILADLGFFSFPWFDWLTANEYFYISRLREKTSFEVTHVFYKDADVFDGLIWLGKYRADRAKYVVRLVTFKLGKREFRYITNVLNPTVLPIRDIALLYQHRWDIEMGFKMVKQHLKLHMLWSGKQQIVMQQIWAVFIIAQILQAIRMEIAGKKEVNPFDVSLELITRYIPELAYEGENPIEMIVKDGERVGIIRPSRRIRMKTPVVPDRYNPIPADFSLIRTPRYAQKTTGKSFFSEISADRFIENLPDTYPLLC